MNAIVTVKPLVEMRSHFFPKVSIEANRIPPAEQNLKKEFGYDYKVDIAVGEFEPKDGAYPVQMVVETRELEGKFKGYSVSLTIVGSVAVVAQVPEEKRKEVVTIVGASLLYGAVREHLYALTLRGPYPPIYLPAVSFMPRPEGSSS